MKTITYILLIFFALSCKTQSKIIATDKTKKDVEFVEQRNVSSASGHKHETQMQINELVNKTITEIDLSVPDSTGAQYPTKIKISKHDSQRNIVTADKEENHNENSKHNDIRTSDKSEINRKVELEKTKTNGIYSLLKQVGLWLGISILVLTLIYGIKKKWK